MKRHPFLFRCDLSNFDYLCSLARGEDRSINILLNQLLDQLREAGVRKADELQKVLRAAR